MPRHNNENYDEIMGRVALAEVAMNEQQEKEYLKLDDNLGEVEKGAEVPLGYKRCGRCGCAKKFYLFNKNSGSKTNTSGNCKDCQRGTAAQSYSNTKSRRNYKAYYRANREKKQEHARNYYQNNKDAIKERHKEYLSTARGQRVMKKAHKKRRRLMADNKGIPYTREMVIERDSVFIQQQHPICYLCEKPITDTTGEGLHIDHIVPVVEKGLDCFTNVACTHKQCNLSREKDARELTLEQVDTIIDRAEAYIDAHPEHFDE